MTVVLKTKMFIADPAEIKEYVSDVSPNHWRVQAAIIHSLNNNVLIVNTYFPTNPKVIGFDFTDLLSTLLSIKDVLQRNDYNSVVWTDDINANFCRQSRFIKIIESFIDQNEFIRAWYKFPRDFTHIYEVNDISYTSTLDHFMWRKNIEGNLIEAGVLHLPINFSDHCPIFCHLRVSELRKLSVKPNTSDHKLASGK